MWSPEICAYNLLVNYKYGFGNHYINALYTLGSSQCSIDSTRIGLERKKVWVIAPHLVINKWCVSSDILKYFKSIFSGHLHHYKYLLFISFPALVFSLFAICVSVCLLTCPSIHLYLKRTPGVAKEDVRRVDVDWLPRLSAILMKILITRRLSKDI